MRDIEDGLTHRAPDWEERMAKWEESRRRNQPEWIVVGEPSKGRRQGPAL